MRVLVTAASKHGATLEIGAAIANALEQRGIEVTLAQPAHVGSVQAYDAVILGSAIYAGHWVSDARDFVERLEEQLAAKPLWVFSSGPVGDPPLPTDEPAGVAQLLSKLHPREHHIFSGAIDKSRLGFAEKAVVRALRVSVGDYRDWDEVNIWAGTIADQLTEALVSGGRP